MTDLPTTPEAKSVAFKRAKQIRKQLKKLREQSKKLREELNAIKGETPAPPAD